MNRLDPLMERTLADIPLNEIAGIRMPKIHEQELGLKLKLFTTGIAGGFYKAGAFCPCLVLHTKKPESNGSGFLNIQSFLFAEQHQIAPLPDDVIDVSVLHLDDFRPAVELFAGVPERLALICEIDADRKEL